MSGRLVLHAVQFNDVYPFAPHWAPLHLSFGPSGRYGIVGPNGSGKTTLLRLLVNEIEQEKGTIRREGVIAYLPQEVVFKGLRTLSDITQTAVSQDELHKWLTLLALHNIDADRRLDTLSGGEARKAALLEAMLKRPDILICDELTNHLDEATRDEAIATIVAANTTFIGASHDPALLGVCNHIVAIEKRGPHLYSGDYAHYETQSALKAAAELQKLAHAKEELEQMRDMRQKQRQVREQRTSRGHKDSLKRGEDKSLRKLMKEHSEGAHGRAQRLHDKRVSAAEERLREARDAVAIREKIRIEWEKETKVTQRLLLRLRGVSHAFDGTPLWEKAVELDLIGGERLFIRGPNGSGKTTLLKLLLGEITPVAGQVDCLYRSAAYLPQNHHLFGDAPHLLAHFQKQFAGSPKNIRGWLAQLGLKGEVLELPLSALSGGERLRAALAHVLFHHEDCELIVFDEPTNHLDLESCQVFLEFLNEVPIAVILVSHDPRVFTAFAPHTIIELPALDVLKV